MKPVPCSATGTRSPLRVPTAARRGPTALAALVAALVLGIVGMHALASHGAPTAPATSSTMSMTGTALAATAHEAIAASSDEETVRSDGSHDEHGPATETHSSMAASKTGVPGSPDSGHGVASMVMLCVVMLAAAALTLLVLLTISFLRPLLPAAFKPASVRARALQWVRGTGPPHEWQFSVIRC